MDRATLAKTRFAKMATKMGVTSKEPGALMNAKKSAGKADVKKVVAAKKK